MPLLYLGYKRRLTLGKCFFSRSLSLYRTPPDLSPSSSLNFLLLLLLLLRCVAPRFVNNSDDLDSIPPHMLGRPSTTKLLHSLSNHDPTSPSTSSKQVSQLSECSSVPLLCPNSCSPFSRSVSHLFLFPSPSSTRSLFLSLSSLSSAKYPQLQKLTLSCSFLVFRIHSYVQAKSSSFRTSLGSFNDPSIPSERGWALVGRFVIIYSGIALSTYWYWEKVFGVSVEYRGGLVGAM